MINFFTQSIILIGTFIWGWIIYVKLARFLNPYALKTNADGEIVSEEEDDEFVDQSRD